MNRAVAWGAELRAVGGIRAIMENHFGYEERHLVSLLDTLDLELTPDDAFGPIAR